MPANSRDGNQKNKKTGCCNRVMGQKLNSPFSDETFRDETENGIGNGVRQRDAKLRLLAPLRLQTPGKCSATSEPVNFLSNAEMYGCHSARHPVPSIPVCLDNMRRRTKIVRGNTSTPPHSASAGVGVAGNTAVGLSVGRLLSDTCQQGDPDGATPQKHQPDPLHRGGGRRWNSDSKDI